MAQVSQHHKKTRMIAVAALIAGIVGLGVAFAAMSTTLLINGTAKIGQATWDVHWATPTICTVTGEATVVTPTLSNSDQTVSIPVTFRAPGDTLTCNLDAVNGGDLAAKLDSATFKADDTGFLTTNNIGYTLKYRSTSGGATVGDNVGAADLGLAVAAKHEMQIIFTNDNASVAGADVSGTYLFEIPYIQNTP